MREDRYVLLTVPERRNLDAKDVTPSDLVVQLR